MIRALQFQDEVFFLEFGQAVNYFQDEFRLSVLSSKKGQLHGWLDPMPRCPTGPAEKIETTPNANEKEPQSDQIAEKSEGPTSPLW